MSQPHAPDSHPFTDAEIAMLHAEDYVAARTVVTLMVSIFVVGVVLYSIVAYAVAS